LFFSPVFSYCTPYQGEIREDGGHIDSARDVGRRGIRRGTLRADSLVRRRGTRTRRKGARAGVYEQHTIRWEKRA